MKNSFAVAVVSLVAFVGCAAPVVDEASEPEASVATGEAALIHNGGGSQVGYTCSGLMCTCTGDDDCNDMFGDGVCGPISSCDTTDETRPVCKCLTIGRVVKAGAGAVAAPAPKTLERTAP